LLDCPFICIYKSFAKIRNDFELAKSFFIFNIFRLFHPKKRPSITRVIPPPLRAQPSRYAILPSRYMVVVRYLSALKADKMTYKALTHSGLRAQKNFTGGFIADFVKFIVSPPPVGRDSWRL
jgi:hypothetical protein